MTGKAMFWWDSLPEEKRIEHIESLYEKSWYKKAQERFDENFKERYGSFDEMLLAELKKIPNEHSEEL